MKGLSILHIQFHDHTRSELIVSYIAFHNLNIAATATKYDRATSDFLDTSTPLVLLGPYTVTVLLSVRYYEGVACVAVVGSFPNQQ